MHSGREFNNQFEDFNEKSDVLNNGKLNDLFTSKLKQKISDLLAKFEHKIRQEECTDNSVYTGLTGYALLYLHLSDIFDPSHLNTASNYAKQSLAGLKACRVTFLCGDAGPLSVAAVVNHKQGKLKESRECTERLQGLYRRVVSDTELPHELLYGQAGYLYALLFIEKKIGKEGVNEEIIAKLIIKILTHGQTESARRGSPAPLYYEWHGKPYIGAAHGIIGILHTLLLARDYLNQDQLDKIIKPSIDYVLTLQYESGNLPSSLGSREDKLIHWCHGAPGAVHLFALAHRVFGTEIYLKAAEKCSNVIWSRGILRKGYGLCHGTAGNAYGFLAMYQLTHHEKYLHRAAKFAEWCFDFGTHGCGKPDRPNSLFEGLAGTIYFLVELLRPEMSAFPAFQI